jgi:hypothetical protein
MTIDRQHLFEIKLPTHVHDFYPTAQRRSGDQKVIVDRQPSIQVGYTYGIYIQRHETTVVWTHAECMRFASETVRSKADAITGSDQSGCRKTLDLTEDEATGLVAVMCSWMQASV